jgi:molybdopterin converting factor small subunit
MIEIHLYGKLRRFSEQKSPVKESIMFVEVLEGDTIHSITTRLGIPPKEMSSSIFLNGEYSGLDRGVKDGDRLGLFPDNMILAYRQYFKKVDE